MTEQQQHTLIEVPDKGPRLQINVGWAALVSVIGLAVSGVVVIRDLQHDSTLRAREYTEMRTAFQDLKQELRDQAITRAEVESFKWRIAEIERRMLEHERTTNVQRR